MADRNSVQSIEGAVGGECGHGYVSAGDCDLRATAICGGVGCAYINTSQRRGMYNSAGSGYEQSPMASERFPSDPSLQLLPSGKKVSDILQQMCGEISQTTTAEIVEIANSAAPRSKLQDLLPVYFYSWQLQSPEAVIIYLLLNYFILWRDGSKRREDRLAFEEHTERLKIRVAEMEKKVVRESNRGSPNEGGAGGKERARPRDYEALEASPRLETGADGKLLCAHDEVSVSACLSLSIVHEPGNVAS